MGCSGSRPDDEVGPSSGTPSSSSSKDPSQSKEATKKKGNKVVQELFQSVGEEKEFRGDTMLIEQDSTKDCAYYIKLGKVKLMLKTESGEMKHLATRGPGDVLGELSLLLGHPATVTAVADGLVSVIEVDHDALMEQLRSDPAKSGRLFKAMAVALAERISELSSKMRANVTSQSASQQQAASQAVPSADVAKARQMFQRPKDEKLLGIYQCSVRRELAPATCHFRCYK